MRLYTFIITSVLSKNTIIKKGGFSGKFIGETFESVEGDDPVWQLLESHMDVAKSQKDEYLIDAMAKFLKSIERW